MTEEEKQKQEADAEEYREYLCYLDREYEKGHIPRCN